MTGIKLGSKFNKYKHDFVYFAKHLHSNCKEIHIGGKAARLNERVKDQAATDNESIIVKNANKKSHSTIKIEDFCNFHQRLP